MSGTTSFKPIEKVKIEPKDIIREKLNNLYTLLVVSLVIVLIVVYAMPKFADKEQKIVENKLADYIWIWCFSTNSSPICMLTTILHNIRNTTFYRAIVCLLVYNYASCNTTSRNCYG